MAVRLSPFLRRPEHVVRCAIPGCSRFGLRKDVCKTCREYHCPEHLRSPIQGSEVDEENLSYMVEVTELQIAPSQGAAQPRRQCYPCGNPSPSIEKIRGMSQEGISVDDRIKMLREEINQSETRQKFWNLLLDRMAKMSATLETLKASPLEQDLWAAMLNIGLDSYFEPQVELYDYHGNYIVRADFASTLLRIAVFTDGRTYHTRPEDVARDRSHNERIKDLGWMVVRYWTEEIAERLDETALQMLDQMCHRIVELQEKGLPAGKQD